MSICFGNVVLYAVMSMKPFEFEFEFERNIMQGMMRHDETVMTIDKKSERRYKVTCTFNM